MKLLLASQSPRRRELLEKLGYTLEVIPLDCDEDYPEGLPVKDVAGYLSQKKSMVYTYLEGNDILLTADTVVVFQNQILGKPKDKSEAFQMLKKLSGQTHEVYTGFTLRTPSNRITKIDRAEVTFAPISDAEINRYIEQGHPMDKAGSYGIQDWLGLAKVTRINGSFYTIMGLPTHLVEQELKELLG